MLLLTQDRRKHADISESLCCNVSLRLFCRVSLMCRFVIVMSLLCVSRPEDAARARVRVRTRSNDHRSNIINATSDHQSIIANNHQHLDKEFRKIPCKQAVRQSIDSSDSGFVSFRRLNGSRHTSAPNAVQTVFGLAFHKCAQVETGSGFPQVRVMLVITNPTEGSDLSQLCIRDAISDITLLETNGSVQETGYQTFTTDSLSAGSEYVVLYRVSVKGNRNQLLILPAFLTFSNATQNDIHLFGPVVANFTLRINATEQVDVHDAVLISFMVSFLLTVLLLSVSVCTVIFLLRRRLRRFTEHRRSLGEEAGPYEGLCDITESANQEAAFEDKFVDIMMLEDQQNMIHALDSLNISTRLRSMVAVELMRVQLCRGLLAVLLGGARAAGRLSVQAECRVVGVVQGQIAGMEGKVQEEHVRRMAALAAQCNLETQEEMQSQQRRHAAERAEAERLFQQTQHQDAVELQALMEKLHTEEQRDLQRRLLARHEHASAQAQRQQTLQRRFELHKIFGEELQEATITGELQENTANKLLLQYYSCQDSLEEVLDVLLANQRALLAERHVHRRFLLQSLRNLQAVMNDAFRSTPAEGECGVFQQWSDVQLEVSRVKQDLEETVRRECRAIRSDIIKRRRGLLSERVCVHRRQLQGLCDASDITVNQYLQKWAKLLLHQNTELSELINHLDKQTAASISKVTLSLLQDSLAQLKAHVAAVWPGAACFLPQTDALYDRLQHLSEADACGLQSSKSCIRRIREQELQQQRNIRETFREYCSCLCASQLSLSSEHRLRLQLECVKAACSLDHCLLLPHPDPAATPADPAATPGDPAATLADPAVTLGDPAMTSAASETQLQRKNLQARLQLLRPTETDISVLQREWIEACVFQEQQLRVCQERVAACVAALQWEHGEKTAKVTETHSALLKLHTLLTEELHNTADITHAIHTHCQALKEAELQLQKEEVVWEESVKGWGYTNVTGDDDDEEEDMFRVDSDSKVAGLLQEAFSKRQQLTQRLTDRVLRRNQAVEHQRDQIQLKRLYTYCQQDLDFTAVLVSQALITAADLHDVLRLLLPTVPEGELLSLIDALEPTAGANSGSSDSLADRLRHDVLSHSPQHRDRERDRLLKRRHKLLVKLFCAARSSSDVREVQHTDRQFQEFSQTPSMILQPKLQITERIVDEEAWPSKDPPHEKSDISTEGLFIFRCSPPAFHENIAQTRRRRKKRNFLNFKSRVAPQ